MDELVGQEFDGIAKAFAVAPPPWRTLHEGSVNRLYAAEGPGGTRVLRLTFGRSRQHLEEEIQLVACLRHKGFSQTLEFVPTVSGEWTYSESPRYVVTAYRYVHGDVRQPLNHDQFQRAVAILPILLDALASVSLSTFPNRRSFPSPSCAIERAQMLCQIQGAPKELRPYLLDPLWPPAQIVWTHSTFIHGDLHAGNFVWQSNDSSPVVLDFERFAIGDPKIDIAAFVTGTCFTPIALDFDRLGLVLEVVAPRLRSIVSDANEFCDVITIMALYFFGRVNRHFIGATDRHRDVEQRDIQRAIELARHRSEVVNMIRNAIS